MKGATDLHEPNTYELYFLPINKVQPFLQLCFSHFNKQFSIKTQLFQFF